MKNIKKIDFYIIIFLFPILILVGKIIRYTIMKSVLVDAGIGYTWINIIASNLQPKEILDLTIASEQNGFAILFFKFINIFNLQTYIDFEILITILFNALLLVMFFKCKRDLTLWQFIFIALSILVLNIFDFCLSKDPIQMIFFLIIFYILLSKNIKHKEFWTIFVISISALIFRKYFLLIIAFMYEFKYIFKFLIKDKVHLNKYVLISVIIVVTYILILIISKYIAPDIYTELVRVRTRVSTAATDIRNVINGDNLILFGINYLLLLIRILFPVELLIKGPKYLMFVVYQFVITISFIKALKNYGKNNEVQNIVLYLFIGFILTSATFEPDFGSWVRHEAVTFPILLIMNGIVSEKNISSTNKEIET